MTVRTRVVILRENNAGQERAFWERQLPQILAEIRHARLREAADPEAPAVPEVDFIRVHLENLLFGETLLELEAQHRFGELAPPVAVRTQEERAGDLHCDGARALQVCSMPQVVPRRAEDANEVEARMLEESLVLGRPNGVDQRRWQIVVSYWPPLFSRAVKEVGNQLRLDLSDSHFCAAAQGPNRPDRLPAELHGQCVRRGEIREFG